MKQNDKRICPKGKGTNLSADLSLQAYGRGSLFNQYKCNRCSYTGQFFPEKIKIKRKK